VEPSSDHRGRLPRLALLALGCRVSRADVDALASELAGAFEVAGDGEVADYVVVNTCSITADADSAARQAIRRAARAHPGAPIVAAGCYAEIAPDQLATLPGVVAVVGARAQGAVPGVLRRLRCGERRDDAVRGAAEDAAPCWGTAPAGPARHTRPFLKVQDGCDQHCAYCVVPSARGSSRSLPFEEALRRIARLGERHPEVVLTGVHLGAYGGDLEPRRSLADLVLGAVREGGVRRLRLSSVEPNELPRALLSHPEVVPSLCPHFHLPLQSGATRILQAMGRPYGPDQYRAVVEDVAARLPGACIGADVLVGFPGETDADHAATVALVQALPLSVLHVFPYSPRQGTRAAAMPGRVPAEVVRARARELRAISDGRWRAFLAAQVGRDLEVVVERIDGGLARGTAREWAPVQWPAIPSDERGALVKIRVQSADSARCFGVHASTSERRLPP
jgi:threonylcarbamoyladenosine tRNA methylthiotransferase MtaB